jgi:hypothetical protein
VIPHGKRLISEEKQRKTQKNSQISEFPGCLLTRFPSPASFPFLFAFPPALRLPCKKIGQPIWLALCKLLPD